MSLLAFSVVGFFLLYVIQRIQNGLPFNPTDMVNVQPDEMRFGMPVRVVFERLNERVTLPVWEPVR